MVYYSNQYAPSKIICKHQRPGGIVKQIENTIPSPAIKNNGGNLALQSATAPSTSHARSIPTKKNYSKKNVRGGYVFK